MANESVIVEFIQSYRGYSRGEKAAFSKYQADVMQKEGIAKKVGKKPQRKKLDQDRSAKANAVEK